MEQNRSTSLSVKQIFNNFKFNTIKPLDNNDPQKSETVKSLNIINEEIIPLSIEKNNKFSKTLSNSNEYLETMTNFKDKYSKCKYCRKKFDRVSDLIKHKKFHTDEQLFLHFPFKCAVCPQGFNSIQKLKTHLKQHPSKKPHKCNVCSKCFLRYESLQHHTLAKHGMSNNN